MLSRRNFLKILTGLGALLIPWTVLPRLEKMGSLVPRPPVKFINASNLDKDGPGEDEFPMPPAEVLARKALADIEALSHPDKEGRRAGTAGETRALVYLEEQLKLLNLQPFGADNYWQMFSIPAMQEKIINGRALFRPDEADPLLSPAGNILAVLPGQDADAYVIISAHYDHLGIYNGKLYPGANDNASGVGCILQVLRSLVRDYCQGIRPKYNIVAAFWGAEEMGFLGSKYFVSHPLFPLAGLKAVINYDTVGNGEREDFILWQVGDSWLKDIMQEAAEKNQARLELNYGGGHQSDEAAFRGTSVPAVTMLSKNWLEKNHTPEDDLSLINPEKLETACSILYTALKKIVY
ncbi:MAG TPA: M20/M25/M40 family metallo-hydrolase [Peptococcaceae bacterium]|nr:M20/M25/M40 family metallo-hydrolase [Peptococcaceae bacterium]